MYLGISKDKKSKIKAIMESFCLDISSPKWKIENKKEHKFPTLLLVNIHVCTCMHYNDCKTSSSSASYNIMQNDCCSLHAQVAQE